MQEIGKATAGSQDADTDIFTDIRSPAADKMGGYVIVYVNVGAAAKVLLTKDGTNYSEMNNGTALVADVAFSEAFPVASDDIINFQLDTTVQLDEFQVFYFD